MIDELNTHLFSFETSIDEIGEIKIPKEKMIDLKRKGFPKVKIDVSGSTAMAINLLDIDEELFNSIKKTQSLPDTIVLNFLQSKGVLNQAGFIERMQMNSNE